MKACLFTFFYLIFFGSGLSAQTKPKPSTPLVIPTKTAPVAISFNDDDEQRPTFPGGLKQFYKYLKKNIHYPREAIKQHIKGVVQLSFVIEKDGSINIVTVTHGISKEIDAEAVRVIKKSPKWHPGKKDGKRVRFLYSLPVRFSEG